MTKKAYAWATGVIEIGDEVPGGALPIAEAEAEVLEDAIDALARHGYKPGVRLVPGVPEAENQREALKALIAFRDWVNRDMDHFREQRQIA